MSYLVLVRHGESVWNKKGIWTGLTDISLSEKGKIEAQNAAQTIQDIPFDIAYTSVLKRAKETLVEMQKNPNLKIIENKALNERDYGDLTGENKEYVKEAVGDKQFLEWRRSFDIPPPNGESLKDVYNRVVPYYQTSIAPNLEEGKNVLIVAHGNSLRALMKYLENISDNDISDLEIATGQVIVYSIDNKGKILNKEIRSA